QPHPFGLGKLHHAALGSEASLMVSRRTGTPEPPKPGYESRQVGGRNGERAERIGEPAWQVLHHALLGERQHVGEGKGGRVAGTRLLADAGAVIDRYIMAGVGQISGCADADDARADDGGLSFSPSRGRSLLRQHGKPRLIYQRYILWFTLLSIPR